MRVFKGTFSTLKAGLGLHEHHPFADHGGGEKAPSWPSHRSFNPLNLQPGPAPPGGFQDCAFSFLFLLCCTTGDNWGTCSRTAAAKPTTSVGLNSSSLVGLPPVRLTREATNHLCCSFEMRLR